MSGRPARSVRLLGEAQHRHEGEGRLQAPGDAVLIRRGVARSLLMRCPDGCGETLAVNLDPRTGKAWRLHDRKGGVTLFPSVWRESGCRSHFIVWRGTILWCDRFEEGNVEPAWDPLLEQRVLEAMRPNRLRSAEDIASELDEIAWEVLSAARSLERRGLARSGAPVQRDWFRRS